MCPLINTYCFGIYIKSEFVFVLFLLIVLKHLAHSVFFFSGLSGYKSLWRSVSRCGVNHSLGFPFISVTEEGGRGGGGRSAATLPTHTYCFHYTVETLEEQWEVGPRRLFFLQLYLLFFDNFMICAFISPHSSSFEDVFFKATRRLF